MEFSVSLIISTYNWPEALNLCLKSAGKQTRLPDEIIIADDGSKTATRVIVDAFKDELSIPVHHVWQEDLGFRKCMILNKAVQRASNPYIIQVDGDVILEPNFIKDHLSVAEPGTFVRGTRAHIKETLLQDMFQKERVEFSCLNKGIKNRFNAFRVPALAWLFTRKRSCSRSVRGSNLAFWKRDFISVNGYSNELQGWGHEDEELAARLVHSGVLRKGLKLKAVQFHITHRIASRTQQSKHELSLRKTLQMKIKRCRNGYQEIQPVPRIHQIELA